MDQAVRRTETTGGLQPEEAPSAAAALGRAPRGGRRWWVWLLVAAMLAGAGAIYAFRSDGGAPAVSFVTATAEPANVTVKITATGTLQPLTQVDISSELSGVVRTVEVIENQEVKKGQVLAQLDTMRIAASVERAQANVKAAAARVTDAKVTLDETGRSLVRSQSLSDRGMLATQSLETATAARDRAQAAVDTADANLAIAEAELKLQQADFEKSTIYAPIDGIVLTRSVDPGQTVASSLQAPVLFVIAADLTSMELQAAIDEADIGSVEKGQKASFTVDAFPGRVFDAEIHDIAYASVTTENVVTYLAKLTVDNEELLLRPGMTATVGIVTKEAQNVLTVPNEAFRFRPPATQRSQGFSLQALFMPPRGRNRPPAQAQSTDGSRTIYVLSGGEPRAMRVRAGATDGSRTEIVSGLDAGDEVIVSLRQQRGSR
ncbi:MAG: efflux RND transporter periplasmic adaptor subunit [Mesorhizobium sp.]